MMRARRSLSAQVLEEETNMQSQKKDGLLSVVITNHNYGQFVGKAIESVARQDYDSIELVVVDDASSDDSVAIIEAALADTSHLERVEFIVNNTAYGKLGVMNRTMDMLRGEYYIVLDADDYFSEVYARRCIGELRRSHALDSDIGFVYTDCNLIDGNGRWLAPGRSTAFDASLLERWSFIPSPAVVLTQAMAEAGPFDESVHKGTKHHVWRRIVGGGWKGLHLPEPLFYYRMHSGNVSGIGDRVISEVEGGNTGERILSGYWPTAVAGS
jgi:glycosyltransferase involved in cell wall biosynthesis